MNKKERQIPQRDINGLITESIHQQLLLIEMAKCGEIEARHTVYQLAIGGDPAYDGDIPHLHIYKAGDNKSGYKNFNLELSLADLLTMDKWVLLRKLDRERHIDEVGRTEDWTPYTSLLDVLKSELFQGPLVIGHNTYIDRLDLIISYWNYGSDQMLTKQGGNPLSNWMDEHHLTPLPKFEKYF